MLVSLTVGKVDAGVTVLLTPDKRLIEFPSILLPPDISSGSIVDITVGQNTSKEAVAQQEFRELQDQIYNSFGASSPSTPVLRCRNATQTSVVLEWDPIELATADLLSLSLFRNGQKAGNIPRPLQMHSTKISGLAVDTEYTFHLVLRTSAGTYASDRVTVRTHKMTDLSGITITTGILPGSTREKLVEAVERIGAKLVDGVRIDTTHFVTTEGRGQAWEKAVETNIPVVRPEWVDACEKNGRILGVTKFYLDAMRPGPPGEEQQPAAQPPAPQPTPPEAQAQPSPSVEEEEKAEADEEKPAPPPKDDEQDEDDEEESEDDHEEESEKKAEATVSEPKTMAAQDQEEQKVRLEDKEEQKVALRPAATSPQAAEEEDEEDDEEQADEKADAKKEKPASTPDGSSFQDVAL
ncbi:Cell fusion protein-like protein [Hapsidospora chrysogenum ATCC 11550]|uniref:Cell fusion protein-like protein n=1 Tax=Hapsidospora chrysogenum (strain ATCC 11550 / CBS 779.69 / DSM 880 / IAM 14645 / JCM 23072 / IMI 49137) TaxID=857340 RepID=A0A086T1R5_HAPC1|nr:Cell fusion protein-like protein [Hapsidospora chrysogenum ATCC 11550]